MKSIVTINAINLSRGILWLLFLFEILTKVGVVKVPGSVLTWPWLVYTIVAYFLLMELPIFLARRNPAYHGYFSLLAVTVVADYYLDAAGNLMNLYGKIVFYDKILHATAFPWILAAISLAVGRILQDKYDLARVPPFLSSFIVLGGMFLSVIHEYVELGIDLGTGSNAGTGAIDIHDTAFDLLADLGGLLIFAVAWSIYESRKAHQQDQPAMS